MSYPVGKMRPSTIGVVMTSNTADNGTPLQAPKGTDQQWQNKVQAAKEARKGAQTVRQGKRASFRPAVGRQG